MLMWLLLPILTAAPPAAPPPNCGVASVIGLRQALGRPMDGAAMRELAGSSPLATVAGDEVARLAIAAGVAVAGYRASEDELEQYGGPAVVHLRGGDGHFACLVGLDEDWAQLLDGWPVALEVIPRPAFAERYAGTCFLPAEVELDQQPAPLTGTVHVQLPAGEAGATVTHEFEVGNDGPVTLELRAGGSSCSCTTVEEGTYTVPPGESTRVTLKLKLIPGRGRLEHVYVATNDPLRPAIYLSIGVDEVPQDVRWTPRALSLYAPAGETARGRVKVIGPPDLTIQVASCDPDIGDVRIVDREVTEHRASYTFEVTPMPHLLCGTHEGRLVVTPRGDGREPFAVPITIRIPDVVIAEPHRIARLDLEPGRFEAEFVLRADGDAVLDVLGATVEGPPLAVELLERIDAARWRVRVGGNLTDGNHRGALVVTTTSALQPVLRVSLTIAVGW